MSATNGSGGSSAYRPLRYSASHRSAVRRGSVISVDDEELRALGRGRAVRVRAVRDLVARPGREREGPAVLQLGRELAFDAQDDVPLLAPVVREVARRVLHHPHADLA